MKQWYVIQVYAGYEEIIKTDILKKVEEKGLNDLLGQVLIPAAKMKQFFGHDDTLQDQQLFPGYMIIEIEPEQEVFQLISKTPRVIRFLGGRSPVALSQKEVERILAQIKGEVVVPIEKHEFELNKEVEIIEGPFAGFIGIIDAIDNNNEKIVVMVSIFGRMTPVELGFDQVKH